MTERLTLNTELKFDPETEDIFIVFSLEGFKQFVRETQFIRVVDKKNKAAFFITTQGGSNSTRRDYIQVGVTRAEPKGPDFTSFSILLSPEALKDLENHGECGDRYFGLTGSEKIKFFIGEPDQK